MSECKGKKLAREEGEFPFSHLCLVFMLFYFSTCNEFWCVKTADDTPFPIFVLFYFCFFVKVQFAYLSYVIARGAGFITGQ